MNIILILWIIGAVILLHYSRLLVLNKMYGLALSFIALAAFPVTGIGASGLFLIGILYYFVFRTPETFNQFMTDIKNELGGV